LRCKKRDCRRLFAELRQAMASRSWGNTVGALTEDVARKRRARRWSSSSPPRLALRASAT
jgi:hypothetical protein